MDASRRAEGARGAAWLAPSSDPRAVALRPQPGRRRPRPQSLSIQFWHSWGALSEPKPMTELEALSLLSLQGAGEERRVQEIWKREQTHHCWPRWEKTESPSEESEGEQEV